jgi:RNA 3'-terminal phosphate cyclase (ATP)
MITIDGSFGEGGGQVLRTALALSMCTGQPLRIENIRAKRQKPGLLRQHLACVRAAKQICGAAVDGDAIGSSALSFKPGTVRAGDYTFTIGSAGSTTLVLQTVLPPLMCATSPSVITLEGGTHNPLAPPFEFLELTFLPLLRRMGSDVSAALDRAGFYPAGGGRFRATIGRAAKLSPIELTARSLPTSRRARAVVAGLPGEIAVRELARLRQDLRLTDDETEIRQLPDEWGPGNVLMLELAGDEVTEIITGFGERGVSAEAVAVNVAREAKQFLANRVPVGEHLADQLLIPMALAGGGAFATGPLSLHATTNIAVVQRFLPDVCIATRECADRTIVVSVTRR